MDVVLNGDVRKNYMDVPELLKLLNNLQGPTAPDVREALIVEIRGMIHRIREMGDFAFVLLRTGRYLIQCVYSAENAKFELKSIQEGDGVAIKGEFIANEKAPNGFEIGMREVNLLSRPAEPMPIVINKKEVDVSLDKKLDNRPVTLRNPKERAIFQIQAGIAKAFGEYLRSQGFTQVFTPKIVFAGAEGGSNIFDLDYFGKKVYLAQSPQFYKQTMVGVHERVFEIGPVFRAEKHDTSRHLNEYISLDFEMGFIDSFRDIMNVEVGFLKHMVEVLKNEYSEEVKLLGAKLPEIKEVPEIKFMDAKRLIESKYKRKVTDFDDFEPEEEQLLGKYAQDELGSEFIFVTHYPSKKRPFYALDDKNDPGYTLSFDLLFRGIEVTTGGQRIHDYTEQVNKMIERGMNPDDFESYLMIHKYGMPPHGGLGAGLERLTMKLLDFQNVRNTSLFPRDINRVTP